MKKSQGEEIIAAHQTCVNATASETHAQSEICRQSMGTTMAVFVVFEKRTPWGVSDHPCGGAETWRFSAFYLSLSRATRPLLLVLLGNRLFTLLLMSLAPVVVCCLTGKKKENTAKQV